MKALVIHGSQDVRVESVADPRIENPDDAIVRVTSTAICGSDLHIYNGFIPQPRPMILGHEFMGIVEEVGTAVTRIKPGDRVVVPFAIGCGTCFFCDKMLVPHCEASNPEKYGPAGGLLTSKGGGLFGYTDLYGGYDGGQAQLVRVPFANFGPRKVPEQLADEEALFLTDILPTGWSAVDWAAPAGGETYAIFGAGPVGLMAMKSAWARGAKRVIAIDIEDYRLEMARKAGKAETMNNSDGTAVEKLREMTHGRGPDICIDAVGLESHRNVLDKVMNVAKLQSGSMACHQACIDAVRRGGFVSTVGVYGMSMDTYPIGQIFDKGLKLAFGQALVHKHIDHLMDLLVKGEIVASDIITHNLKLDQAPEAYKTFCNMQERCVKVVLHP
jgi:S-(hydroxymethyl)glutathione dehydrogenase/alcohol dehydrogenase